MAKPEQPVASDQEQDRNDEGSEEGSEEEYEIETILEARRGIFEKGKYGYFVKWKGYSEEHNSWVREEDAGNAQDLITEYWNKKQNQKPAESVSAAKRSRARPSDVSKAMSVDSGLDAASDEGEQKLRKKKRTSTAASAKAAGNGRKSLSALDQEGDTDMANGETQPEYRAMTQYMSEKNWEDLVKEVRTVERVDGDLMVFFQLHSGDNMREKSSICRKKFPQKLIQFYEDNLRWRSSDETV